MYLCTCIWYSCAVFPVVHVLYQRWYYYKINVCMCHVCIILLCQSTVPGSTCTGYTVPDSNLNLNTLVHMSPAQNKFYSHFSSTPFYHSVSIYILLLNSYKSVLFCFETGMLVRISSTFVISTVACTVVGSWSVVATISPQGLTTVE